MRLLEAVGMAFRTIRSQKLKSVFSLIGVLIGVTFLIAVVSIVQGMNRYMVDRFANTLVGANTFELRQRPSIVTGNVSDDVWLAWRRRPRISYADAEYVRERLRTPATFAKFCEDRVSVHYDGRVAKDIYLVGTEASYFEIRNYEVSVGRAFTAQEVQMALPVLVVGHELADKLLPGVDPVGKTVQMGGLPYRIIGVVAKQGTLFGISLDKFAIMPFSAPGRRLICPINILDALIVRTSDPTAMQGALDETEAIMRSRRGL
jgi:putative ABC transport system permease protein